VTAYCKRFAFNTRQKKVNRLISPLSAQELDTALLCCVKLVQHICYKQELQDLQNKQEVSTKTSLKCLHPFVDQEGLLQVGGRLQHSSLPYDAIHQLILSSNHHFTRLISAEHMKLLRAGPQLLIACVRQRFWIPHIKNLIKSVIYQCLTC
jgi:hypothetical protein